MHLQSQLVKLRTTHFPPLDSADEKCLKNAITFRAVFYGIRKGDGAQTGSIYFFVSACLLDSVFCFCVRRMRFFKMTYSTKTADKR